MVNDVYDQNVSKMIIQYMHLLFLQAGFESQGHAAVAPELDLVDAEDQITHEMELEEKHDPQANLNVFKWVQCTMVVLERTMVVIGGIMVLLEGHACVYVLDQELQMREKGVQHLQMITKQTSILRCSNCQRFARSNQPNTLLDGSKDNDVHTTDHTVSDTETCIQLAEDRAHGINTTH